MILSVLGSGSKGNCIYINNPDKNESILVDAGLSWKKTSLSATTKGLDLNTVKGIVITHEHSDHCNRAFVISRKLGNIPIYFQINACNKISYKFKESEVASIKVFFYSFHLSDFHILCFDTSHYSANPIGLLVTAVGTCKTIGIATDLGMISDTAGEYLKMSDILVLESNHDPKMLWNGTYPEHIKMRVAGNKGHLSNKQSALFINTLDPDKTKHVLLAHISKDNNSIEKINSTFGSILGDKIPMLHIADQVNGSSVFKI